MITDLLNQIDNGKWMILPSYLKTMREQCIRYMSNNFVKTQDEEDDDECPECGKPMEECTCDDKKVHLHNITKQADALNEDLDQLQEPDEEEVGIADISINGPLRKSPNILEQLLLGMNDIDEIANQIEMAGEDERVQKILLHINSPGGETTGIEELGELVSEINAKKPVFVFSDGKIASAAYWIGSQATAIYTTKSTDVGSIGVYCLLLDESRRLENEGIKVNAISAGKYKLMGAPFTPLTEEERNIIQADVNNIWSKFKNAVSNNRPDVKPEDMEGQVFDGETALTKGLTDGIVRNKKEVYALIAEL